MNLGYLPKEKNFFLSLILVSVLSCRNAWPEEATIYSTSAGECKLSVETDDEWRTLRLRAHHPRYKGCRITERDMTTAMEAAFLKTEVSALKGGYSSLSIGRLIDYPWLSQFLADAAYRDHGWNAMKGKPVAMGFNNYVSHILNDQNLLAPLQTTLAKADYRIVGVSVEKVLVGGFNEVPLYKGIHVRETVPFDAQVWFRLGKK